MARNENDWRELFCTFVESNWSWNERVYSQGFFFFYYSCNWFKFKFSKLGEIKVGNSKLVFSVDSKKQTDDDYNNIFQISLTHKG